MTTTPLVKVPRPTPAEHPDGEAHDHPDLERRRRAAMHPRVAQYSVRANAGANRSARVHSSGNGARHPA